MKKLIITIVCIAVLAITACFIYFNSDSYKYKLASEYRAEKLNRLNAISRRYIHEGVYTFDSYETLKTSFKDKFGETVTNTSTNYYGEGEVSFKNVGIINSNVYRIVILLKNKREEITLAEPYIPDYGLFDGSVKYWFPIVHWEAFKNNILFFQFDSTENKELRESYNSQEYKVYDFLEPTLELSIMTISEDGQIQAEFSTMGPSLGKSYGEVFWTIPKSDKTFGRIKLNNLKHKYESVFSNVYANAKFEKSMYDIETYLDWTKNMNYKNPFILNKKWK